MRERSWKPAIIQPEVEPAAPDLQAAISRLLTSASEMYENDPVNGLRPQAFLFQRDTENPDKITATPLMIQFPQEQVEQLQRMGISLERAALDQARFLAADVGQRDLFGVGFLFPEKAHLPMNQADASAALWLDASEVSPESSPFGQEGVVIVVDHPGGRGIWAALRPVGEILDPLALPCPLEAAKPLYRDIDPLYPFGWGRPSRGR